MSTLRLEKLLIVERYHLGKKKKKEKRIIECLDLVLIITCVCKYRQTTISVVTLLIKNFNFQQQQFQNEMKH